MVAAPAEAQLFAAVLPTARSVQVGEPATAFATIINSGSSPATGCTISPFTSVPATFLYQTTDPATNALTGTPNTPVDIAAGGSQSFLIAFTPTAQIPRQPVPPFEERNYVLVALTFVCTNTDPAPVSTANRLTLSATPNPQPDLVAVIATTTGDGIVNIPSAGTGAFAVAVTNIGADTPTAVGARIAVTGPGVGGDPYRGVFVCQTDPMTAACVTPLGDAQLPLTIATGETMTFSVFLQGTGLNFAFDPAVDRTGVTFGIPPAPMHNEVIWGAASVAWRVVP